MKKKHLVLAVAIMLIIGCLPECTKTNVVYGKLDTLTLTASKDASIFIQDAAEPLYADNGSGASDLLRVGYSNQGKYFVRTLVAFDLSSLPPGAILQSATLSFTLGKSGDNLTHDTVSVHRVTKGWTEGTTDDLCEFANYYCSIPGTAVTSGGDATWNSTSSGGTAWTTPGGDFVSQASATVNYGGTNSFSSKEIVNDIKGWVIAPTTNFGWILKATETSFVKNGGEQIRYFSREASTAKAGRTKASTTGADGSTKPTLTIIYHK